MADHVEGTAYPCNHCQAGMMNLRFITYLTRQGGELITVPGFPAWVCDVCGKREFDGRAVNWISTMLRPDAGQSPAPRPARRIPGKKRGADRPSMPD